MPRKLNATGYAPSDRSLAQFVGTVVVIDTVDLSTSPQYGNRATLWMTAYNPETGEALGERTRVVSFGEAVLDVCDHLTEQGRAQGLLEDPIIVKVVKDGPILRLVDPDEEAPTDGSGEDAGETDTVGSETKTA